MITSNCVKFLVSDVDASHDYYSFLTDKSSGIHVDELRDVILHKKKQNSKLFEDEFKVYQRQHFCLCIENIAYMYSVLLHINYKKR